MLAASRRVAFALTLAAAQSAAAQQPSSVRVRFDVMTPTRDGITLASDLWLPADSGRWPTILIRTPYMKAYHAASFAGLANWFALRGYAVAIQDVRGRGDSEGRFTFFQNEGKDGFDTIEWIAKQPWSNGRVGMMGLSYLGAAQWLAAREHPPHLACIAPTAAAGRWLDELPSVGGAFMMEWSLTWLQLTAGHVDQSPNMGAIDWARVFAHRPLLTMDSVMGRTMPIYREFLAHPTLDAHWKRLLFGDADFAGIDIPALTVTGSFDADQKGATTYWNGMRAKSPARDKQWFVMGPWNHPQTFRGGDSHYNGFEFSADARIDTKVLHERFFDWCLKKSAPSFEQPRAHIYFTGSNVWRDFDEFPPREATPRLYHLSSGGHANTLDGDGQLVLEAQVNESPDSFTYDPRHPVPSFVGDAGDQRDLEKRADVLVYTSDALTEPVDIAGRVAVRLSAATDGRDTDWTAKLVDVFPDGRALIMAIQPAGIIRARYRKGLDREVLLTPNAVESYTIDLFHTAHTFLPGHRIRIEISSSSAPHFNPNQNTGNPVATDTVFRVARQTVYHDTRRISALVLPVILRATR